MLIISALTPKARLYNLNVHPLEVVSRYFESQLQVGVHFQTKHSRILVFKYTACDLTLLILHPIKHNTFVLLGWSSLLRI